MEKIEALDPELKEIGWQRFNFQWCTGYSLRWYQRGLYLLIHKETNNYRKRRLFPIILFDTEANINNNNTGRWKPLKDLTPKNMVARKPTK